MVASWVAAVGLVAMVGAAKAPEEATHETNHGNSDLHSMPAVGLVAMVGAALHELAMPPLTSPKPPSAGSTDVVHCLTMPPPLIHAEPPSAGSEDVVHCLTMPLAVGLVAMVGAAKAPEEATHETNHGNSDLHSMPAVGLVAMVGAALHELAMPPLTSPKPPSAGSADVVHCLTMPPPLIHAEPPSAGSEDVVNCLTMPLAPICGQAETRTRTSSCAR
jgi:2-methylcitrate dehydratase PrpD